MIKIQLILSIKFDISIMLLPCISEFISLRKLSKKFSIIFFQNGIIGKLITKQENDACFDYGSYKFWEEEKSYQIRVFFKNMIF